MAYEEVQGNNYEEDDREFISAKIGTEFEGTFVRMSNEKTSQYGPVRYVSFDLIDGRKVIVPARKILMERLHEADLEPGDLVKVVVGKGTSKETGYNYALPRVYVDRGAGEVTASATSPAVSAPVDDDNPPF